MLFSLLLWVVSLAIGNTAKKNKSIKEMLTIRDTKYVIMTKDGKRGRRYIFRYGKFLTDTVLTEPGGR